MGEDDFCTCGHDLSDHGPKGCQAAEVEDGPRCRCTGFCDAVLAAEDAKENGRGDYDP